MKSNLCNVENRSIFCSDNLDILRNINSDCVDLIYLDPPFNKKKVFAAPIGSSAEGASFSDVFKEEDVKEEWVNTIKEDNEKLRDLLLSIKQWSSTYNFAYSAYMAIRLLEMRRILKDTGSIYLHCDPTMSHYLKLLLDCIFGEQFFRNEIVWFYYDTPGRSIKYYPKKSDTIFFYTKSDKWCFNGDSILVPIKEISKNRYKYSRVIGGKSYVGGNEKGKIPENVWQIPAVKKNSKESSGYHYAEAS